MTVVMRRCDHCKLLFHKPPGQGTPGCQCNGWTCGCRILRDVASQVLGDKQKEDG